MNITTHLRSSDGTVGGHGDAKGSNKSMQHFSDYWSFDEEERNKKAIVFKQTPI